MQEYLVISQKVKHALENNIPVVALESTIISHGMPYPQNYETALACEKIVEDSGCVAATIAIIHGKIHVGLTHEEIEYIAKTGLKVVKTSRRDLAYVCACGYDGATTVSATMYLAHLAGIKVFATGGIGGVHREAHITMDISADLEELGKTPVCVVCAGVKAILDLERTLEYLETKGVLVLGFDTEYLPDFYTRRSPYKLLHSVKNASEVAKIIKVQSKLGLECGMIVANPIPEEYSLDEKVMNEAIDEALIKLNASGVKGKDITPFLLKEVVERTGGKSLEANIKLVFNNCLVAANIAKELNK